jgi:SRSO17 transposase
MNRRQLAKLRKELEAFADELTAGLGRRERRAALQQYLHGLLLEGERKAITPMAARMTDENDAPALRQRLQQAVVVAEWDTAVVFQRIARRLVAGLPKLEAYVIDDTGFPKQGEHSVGVARQYSGTLGRVDRCQVAPSLHVASEYASGCIGMQLYLPEAWASNEVRRRKASVPESVGFTTKWRLAVEMLERAQEWGLPNYVVLADAGYGEVGDFRRELERLGLSYVVGIPAELAFWPPGSNPKVPEYSGRGRRPTQARDPQQSPMSARALVAHAQLRKVTWRSGSKGMQSARFAALRVRTAHGWTKSKPPGDEQWLLIEATNSDKRPYKFYLSNLPPNTSAKQLVRLAKMRWRVERDYRELKEELGLDHFEGRTWNGFHHHVALCCAAHAFLATRRALSPLGSRQHHAAASPP